MMKKLLSLFLGAALLMSAVLPAALAAEDAADEYVYTPANNGE